MRQPVAPIPRLLINYSWQTGNVALRELADHAPINYVAAVSADASQPKLANWTLVAKR